MRVTENDKGYYLIFVQAIDENKAEEVTKKALSFVEFAVGGTYVEKVMFKNDKIRICKLKRMGSRPPKPTLSSNIHKHVPQTVKC